MRTAAAHCHSQRCLLIARWLLIADCWLPVGYVDWELVDGSHSVMSSGWMDGGRRCRLTPYIVSGILDRYCMCNYEDKWSNAIYCLNAIRVSSFDSFGSSWGSDALVPARPLAPHYIKRHRSCCGSCVVTVPSLCCNGILSTTHASTLCVRCSGTVTLISWLGVPLVV